MKWWNIFTVALATMLTRLSLGQDGAPVLITVYYESHSPQSADFITKQLWQTFREMSDILEVDLVPYGLSQEVQTSTGSWLFHCRRGVEECYHNMLHTCALKLYNETKTSLGFVDCTEKNINLPYIELTCAQIFGLDYNALEQCVNGEQGNAWQHEMAEKTQSAEPPIHYIPRITINGDFSISTDTEAKENLLGVVCKIYAGPKAEQFCPQEETPPSENSDTLLPNVESVCECNA